MSNENHNQEEMMRANAQREVMWGGVQGRTESEMESEMTQVMNRMRMEAYNNQQ